MRNAILLILVFISLKAKAQEPPYWIVLEKANEFGIIKPGANDIMFYIGSKMKTLDKPAFSAINGSIVLRAGSAALVIGKTNEDVIATDIEGRTMIIKGKITPAQGKAGSGVVYLKEDIQADGAELKQGMYMWMKSRDDKSNTGVIQCANGKTKEVPLDKVYIIDQTTGEMAGSIPYKGIE